MVSPVIEIKKEIQEVVINRGEVITVWLSLETPDKNIDRIQVELRVTPSGVPEIYSEIASKNFSQWYVA